MKKIIQILVLALIVLFLYFRVSIYPQLDLISGFSAKSVASGHFIDHRPLTKIQEGDNDIPKVNWATNTIIDSQKWAISKVYGLKERKAIYREGLGATLIDDDFDINATYEVPNRHRYNDRLPYPYGNMEPKDTLFANIDYVKLRKAVKEAFDYKNQKIKRTRAVLVIYKDKIIAEKYDDDFSKDSKILGWSMTKSITATYFGILQKQGKLNVMMPAPIEEWKNDSRKNITINNLLQMNSGLEWEEDYTKICDATQMLFQAKNMTETQIKKQSLFPPNSHWNYSSGTTNVLSNILRKQFKTHQEYLDFWYSSLLDKIGMNSAIIETDMAGNFVGSSYGWATTRDWGKFGLLYLHKGNWNGDRLFNEDWVKYITTPTPTSNGRYGAQFWLNSTGHFPDLPENMFYASGYQGQIIGIFPTQNLVIVRMGLSEEPNFNFNQFFKQILGSIQNK